MAQKHVSEILKDFQDRLGVGLNEFSRKIGAPNASSIQRYTSKNYEKDQLPEAVMKKIMRVVGEGSPPILEEEVLVLAMPPSMRDAKVRSTPAHEPEKFGTTDQIRDKAGPVRISVGPKDLPVFASAQGGPGDLTFNQEPIDYVVRPDPLERVKDGYAIYVIGDSMSPAYEHGDLALVHPFRPFSPNDDVLIFREEGHEFAAIIKRLVKATTHKWTLKQFNPAKELVIDRADWPKCHVIVGSYNRRR